MWAEKYIMQKFTEETKMDNEYFDIAKNLMKFIEKSPSALYRPPKVRPKNLTIGGRYFYGKIQL